jgi:small subunit ribosomal protein S12
MLGALKRRNYGFVKKKNYSNTLRLRYKTFYHYKCPQLKGTVAKMRIVTPRKPNSARRQCVKVILSNALFITAYIRGSGHNLRKYSEVLVSGGGARDLPGVNYRCIRGVLGLMGLVRKRRRRSIYGAKNVDKKVVKLRRKFRKLFM